MMELLPEGFPHGLDDTKLHEAVDSMARTLEHGEVGNDPLRVAPLVDLGLAELARRETRKGNRTALGISLLAVLLAAGSVVWTTLGDRGWRRDELRELRRIEQRLVFPTPSVTVVVTPPP